MAQYEVAYTSSYFTHYPERMTFLKQFDTIFSPYDYPNLNVVAAPPFLPWMLNSNLQSWMTPHPRDWQFLTTMPVPAKSELVSMIVSDKAITSAQRERLRFAERAKRHFGSDLEWFGTGINPVAEKFDAIAPYRFHIALENRIGKHIWTEKLVDSFLGWSFPLYWGAPNASTYFPTGSFSAIDVSRPTEALRRIGAAIRSDVDKRRRNSLHLARSIALNSLNFVNRLARVAWDVYCARNSDTYFTRSIAGPLIPSNVGYRALNNPERLENRNG